MSREHVLPRWLRDAVEVGDQPGTHILGIDQERVREWQALPFTTQSRRVCLSCNTGWMARLEDDTRPILGPLIGGPIDTVLSVDQQAVATSWALKTAMCVQLISPREWWPIPQRHFAQLYESRDGRLPLPGSYAWLGRYRASRPQTRHLIQPLQIDAETKGLAHPPDAYAASFAVGEMAIQVVGRFSPTTDLTFEHGDHLVVKKHENTSRKNAPKMSVLARAHRLHDRLWDLLLILAERAHLTLWLTLHGEGPSLAQSRRLVGCDLEWHLPPPRHRQRREPPEWRPHRSPAVTAD